MVEQSVTDGLKTVRCRGITEVPIALIAPDVTMAEFKGSVVALSDIQKGKMIGEGGFAKVKFIFLFENVQLFIFL